MSAEICAEGYHHHAEPIPHVPTFKFLVLFPSTTHLVARAAMAKKGTNPRPTKLPLPSGAPGFIT